MIINCQHERKIGDNYGLSCQDCNEALEGYGYGGFFGSNLKGNEGCIHGMWCIVSPEQEECYYCNRTRERKNKPN